MLRKDRLRLFKKLHKLHVAICEVETEIKLMPPHLMCLIQSPYTDLKEYMELLVKEDLEKKGKG